jgi:hypothetical protein
VYFGAGLEQDDQRLRVGQAMGEDLRDVCEDHLRFQPRRACEGNLHFIDGGERAVAVRISFDQLEIERIGRRGFVTLEIPGELVVFGDQAWALIKDPPGFRVIAHGEDVPGVIAVS